MRVYGVSYAASSMQQATSSNPRKSRRKKLADRTMRYEAKKQRNEPANVASADSTGT
jgi:hypothetical protein